MVNVTLRDNRDLSEMELGPKTRGPTGPSAMALQVKSFWTRGQGHQCPEGPVSPLLQRLSWRAEALTRLAQTSYVASGKEGREFPKNRREMSLKAPSQGHRERLLEEGCL